MLQKNAFFVPLNPLLRTDLPEQPVTVPENPDKEDRSMEISDAFGTLETALSAVLQQAQKNGAQELQQGHLEQAKAAIARSEELRDIIRQLQILQQRCEALDTSKPAPKKPVKAQVKRSSNLPRGQKTSEVQFRLPILAVLSDLNGSARISEVLERLETMFKDRFTQADHERLPSNQDIRWQNTVKWARQRLVNEGLLAADSPRGVWEITPEGRTYLEKHHHEL